MIIRRRIHGRHASRREAHVEDVASYAPLRARISTRRGVRNGRFQKRQRHQRATPVFVRTALVKCARVVQHGIAFTQLGVATPRFGESRKLFFVPLRHRKRVV